MSYRHLFVWRGGALVPCTPPHDILDQPVAGHLPGEAAGVAGDGSPAAELAALQARASDVLERVRPGTSAWFWGEGTAPRISPFRDHFGLSGAVVGAVDLVRGIGRLAGLDVIDVPGATGGLDTDYGAKARAAIAALADHDLVWVHVESPDEAGHMGDLREKVRAIERVDAEVLAPILASAGRPAVLVVPDHLTPLRTRTHAAGPVPFAIGDVAAGGGRWRRHGLRGVAGRHDRPRRRERHRAHAAVPRGDGVSTRLRRPHLAAAEGTSREAVAAAAMSSSHEQPERQPARERPADEPVVTTTSAERYVMSGGRASRLAVKEGDLFLYTNELGQVPGTENSVLGLYYRDTRYLSRYVLSIAGRQPVLLSASAERGYAATIELTNLEARTADGHVLPQASVHVRRTRFVSDRLYELLRVRNYHQREVDLVLDLDFDADFADLFEVRGSRRRRRGSRLAPRVSDGTLTLSYLGLDDVTRQTIVRFHDRPESLKQGRARFRLRLPPGERAVIRYDVQVVGPEAPGEAGGEFNARIGALRHEHERWASDATDIFTDNDQLNRALRRGQDDLRLLSTVIDGERVPLSGLPWFGAPFGREMTFVGLETLLLDLRWARSAVSFLARRQGVQDSAFREEQPGKIMHELRRGELAAIRAVPHTPYYGSVDSTALWLLLVAELAVWTGDLDGFELRAAAVDAALGWIDGPGDPDGDGFVEYERRSRVGLRNQGWRDSFDAVLHEDGTPAAGPIALAETQGYVYYAKRRLAAVFGQLGDVERAERLSQDAARLKRAFNERFWIEDQGFYAMALDGQKRQVRSASSTIGHALWSRIVAEEHIPAVVEAADGAGHVHRVGHPHAQQGSALLQPGELLQRQRVAVRHRAHRERPQEARLRAGGEPPRLGAGGGGGRTRVRPPAGDVLRVHAADGRPPGLVPHGLLARRQLGRRAVPRPAVDAGHLRPGRGEHRLRPRPGAAALAGRGDAQQPARRPHHHAPPLPPRGRADELLGTGQAGAGAYRGRRVSRSSRPGTRPMTELTIAHISDIHAGSPYFVPSLMDRVVVELNELEPDVVLCTGDLTEMGFRQDYVTAKEYMDRIQAPLVVIPGNHDARNVGYVHFEELIGPRWQTLSMGGVKIVALDSSEPDLDYGQIGRARYDFLREEFGRPATLPHLHAPPPRAAHPRHRARAQHGPRRRRPPRGPPGVRRQPGALRPQARAVRLAPRAPLRRQRRDVQFSPPAGQDQGVLQPRPHRRRQGAGGAQVPVPR